MQVFKEPPKLNWIEQSEYHGIDYSTAKAEIGDIILDIRYDYDLDPNEAVKPIKDSSSFSLTVSKKVYTYRKIGERTYNDGSYYRLIAMLFGSVQQLKFQAELIALGMEIEKFPTEKEMRYSKEI